jgi:class 3 adenylate cyclase
MVRIPVLGLLALLALWDAHKRDLALCTHFVQNIMLEEQAKAVEEYDEENTRLLKSMLPAPIVEKLKQKIPVPAEYFAQVTVIFVQICEFSHLAEVLTSHKLVKLLNMIYSKFDDVTDEHEVYKIETVGEVYVAVAGCPKVSFLLCTVTLYANIAHCLTRSP